MNRRAILALPIAALAPVPSQPASVVQGAVPPIASLGVSIDRAEAWEAFLRAKIIKITSLAMDRALAMDCREATSHSAGTTR